MYLFKDTADVTTYYKSLKKNVTRKAMPEMQVDVWYNDMTPAGYKAANSELGQMFVPSYEEFLKTK